MAAGIGAGGILRWRWHRRVSFLVIPKFRAVRESEGKAERAQELIVDGLSRALPRSEQGLVHAVPATVGPTDGVFAEQLRRRLHAYFVVQGRIDDRPNGEWSVYAAVTAPADSGVTHIGTLGIARPVKRTGI
jgi:serine/threonine protein kinase HipA of HipAB toxin-antitoxin module